MSSIWTICRKELRLHALERQVQIVVLMGILLTLTTSLVGSLYHQQRHEDYEAALETGMEERRAAKVYADLRPVVIDPPRLLSIFAQGVDAVYGETVAIVPDVGSRPACPAWEPHRTSSSGCTSRSMW